MAVRRELDQSHRQLLTVKGANDDAVPDLLRRNRCEVAEGIARRHVAGIVHDVIARVWHAWTKPEDADAYGEFLRTSVLPELTAEVEGFLGAYVLRREGDGEVEFLVITRFDSLDAVRAFAGDDYEVPVIEPEAVRLLIRGDERAAHYEVVS